MAGPGDGYVTISLRRAVELDATRTILSTGSKGLDELLGGGLRTSELVEVFGASNTGKSQLGMQAAALAGSRGLRCVYVDTEGQFRPERLSSICSERGLEAEQVLRKVHVLRAETTRRQSEAIQTVRRDPKLQDCKLVVVDTLTKNFSLEMGGRNLVGKRQTLLGAYLNRLSRDAYLNDRSVLLLNRVASIGLGDASREVDIGGQTVRHFVQRAVHLRRTGHEILVSLDSGKNRAEARTRISPSGLE